MWAGLLAFTENHLRLTDRVGSLYSFLVGGVGAIVPVIFSQYFKSNPLILFQSNAVFLFVSAVSYSAVLVLIAMTRRDKHSPA